MPSRSLSTWFGDAADALNQLEAAHRAVGGRGPGRRYATQHLNQAAAVLLCAQFQRYCRDLQSEAVDVLAAKIPDRDVKIIFRRQMTTGRKLDAGNPNPGNIGSDFGRLGFDFWPALINVNPVSSTRRKALETLMTWRNAIAHQDFDPNRLGGRTQLRLAEVRRWRNICNALARDFDKIVSQHLATIVGAAPW
jgi:HEPN superfamily RiboL-PSP-like protein